MLEYDNIDMTDGVSVNKRIRQVPYLKLLSLS